MKYRQKPEDFIVEEIADHKILKSGKYKLYYNKKKNIETFALLDLFARVHKIPRLKIGIAGIKDTHAKTKQFISIPQQFELKNTETVKVEFLGYINNGLKLGDLKENKFIITVRDIKEKEIENILKYAEAIKDGIPNYFDSQRFGSVIDGEFIAKDLIEKKYELAVKKFLTCETESDSAERNLDKDSIHDSWPNLKDIKISSPDLKNVVNAYNTKKKWIVAYKYIPASLRQIYISSYQSYLWNECIKELLKEKQGVKELFKVPYAVDELIFNKNPIKNLPRTFQTISHRMKPNDYEEQIIKKVLEKEKLSIEKFNIRQTGNFFKTTDRDIMIYPTNFEIGKPKKDGDRYFVTVKFSLSKGSYATMVLKKIFGQ